MGLFGGKKTYVDSTVYNLAGDIEKRTDFLKTLMTSRALGLDNRSFPEQMRDAYVSGPGMRLRKFARWAKNNYKQIGVGTGNLYSVPEIAPGDLAKHILHAPDVTISIQHIDVGPADHTYWAENWLFANEPGLVDTDWTSSYDPDTKELTIDYEDGGGVTIEIDDYQVSGRYIYALYTENRGEDSGPLVQGEVDTLIAGENFPSTDGWDQKSSNTTTVHKTLAKVTKTVTSYSDDRPDVTKTNMETSQTSYDHYEAIYEKIDYNGIDPDYPDLITQTRQVMNLARRGEIKETVTETSEQSDEGGVTKTVTTTVTETKLEVSETVRIDTQDIQVETTSGPKLFIYRLGSGKPAIDALVSKTEDNGFYFPFIPVRIDNKFLSSAYLSDAYEASVKAYKKAVAGDYDDLVSDLAGNESLDDIDYAYVLFGVSLNTKENTGKKYLFDFFEKLRLTQQYGADAYSSWSNQQSTVDQEISNYNNWRLGQAVPGSELFGSNNPGFSSPSSMAVNSIHIQDHGSLDTNMDILITWSSIEKTTGEGLAKPGASKGECWLSTGATDSFSQDLLLDTLKIAVKSTDINTIYAYHQIDEDSWERLEIRGLHQKNRIHKNKSVEIDAKDALEDDKESGFLIPLHYDTFVEMSLIESTQLSTACCYLVINSYVVKHTGFFSSGFFKFLAIIAIVAISVATGGIGASGIGLLGTNIAVGTAIGLSGTLAIIAGAVANAIVAMVVTKIISAGAVAVFGDKLGSIIGAIASVVALQVGTSFANGSSLASSFSNLIKADNLLALTNATGSGISGYIQSKAMDTLEKTQDLQEQYEQRSDDLQDQYLETFGYGVSSIDPLFLAQARSIVLESSSTFLERTLMTGSDVAELSTSLLSDFPKITLSTELPL